MTHSDPAPQDTALVLDYELDAPPEKVWQMCIRDRVRMICWRDGITGAGALARKL